MNKRNSYLASLQGILVMVCLKLIYITTKLSNIGPFSLIKSLTCSLTTSIPFFPQIMFPFSQGVFVLRKTLKYLSTVHCLF